MNITYFFWEEKIKKKLLHPHNLIYSIPLLCVAIYYFARNHFLSCTYNSSVCIQSEYAKELICQPSTSICNLPTWWNIFVYILIFIGVLNLIINWLRILLYQYKKHNNQ